MYSELRPGDTVKHSIIDGDLIHMVETRLLKRVRTDDLVSEIRRANRPSVATGGLPQRCRWFGSSETARVYLCEMPPRLVDWRFQPYLDPDGVVAVPVALPYQIYAISTTPAGSYQKHLTYWSARPLPSGSAIYTAPLLQYAAPNVSPGSGYACLGTGGVGAMPSLTGVDAMLVELHRVMAEDRNGTDLSGANITAFLPSGWETQPLPPEPTVFGLPVSRWGETVPCMQYALQLGLWRRAQSDPLRAVCDLPWRVIGTVRSALSDICPEISL